MQINSIEVRVPVSPMPSMFTRVWLIVHAIESWNLPQEIKFRFSVSSINPPFDITETQPWSLKHNVEWAWAPQDACIKWQDSSNPHVPAMVFDRLAPTDADLVLWMDADVLPINPIDFSTLPAGISGVMAHASPFPENHYELWGELASIVGTKIDFSQRHSGDGFMTNLLTPTYFNTGTLFLPRPALNDIRDAYVFCVNEISKTTDSYFVDQIALTLACGICHIPMSALPTRFNFPNQPEFDRIYPDDLKSIHLLHYLRTGIVDRDHDFEFLPNVDTLVRRTDLRGSNEVLRAKLESLLPALRADYAPKPKVSSDV